MAEKSVANRQYFDTQQRMELLWRYYEWIISSFQEALNGTLYDLGCGGGLGIRDYLTVVDKVVAVDHDAELLDSIRRRYDGEEVLCCQADLEGDWVSRMPDPADSVVAMDIVEHLQDDYAFVKRVSSLLKPGGIFVMKVPAHDHWYSEIDQASGHVRRYDERRLKFLADAGGLTLQRCVRFNVLGGLAYRFKSGKARTNFSKTFPAWQLRLINLLIPVVRLADHCPFGKGLSWIVIMAKPNN